MKGSDVKRILKTNGYTLTRVAKIIGKNQQTLSEALKVDNIRIELLERIAKAIGKDTEFFFNDGRPVSQQIEKIEALYEETLKLYSLMLKVSKDINCSLLLIANTAQRNS
jgi:transcriptional regulator with XRE-family HTH domain